MKKHLLLAVCIMGMAFTGVVPGHVYKMSLTQEKWGSFFSTVHNARIELLNSSLPTNQVLPLADTLSQLEQQIQIQIGEAIAADTTVKPKK
jgi:hypothetical protein